MDLQGGQVAKNEMLRMQKNNRFFTQISLLHKFTQIFTQLSPECFGMCIGVESAEIAGVCTSDDRLCQSQSDADLSVKL